MLHLDLLRDPGVSYWLKSAIQRNLERDPVDALSDAKLLVRVMEEALDLALERG
jgi:hypothetical protein